MCLVVQKQEKSRASLLEENVGHGVGTVRLLTETAGMKEEGDFQILQLHMATVSVALPVSSFPIPVCQWLSKNHHII